jgi:hypothetical protein
VLTQHSTCDSRNPQQGTNTPKHTQLGLKFSPSCGAPSPGFSNGHLGFSQKTINDDSVSDVDRFFQTWDRWFPRLSTPRNTLSSSKHTISRRKRSIRPMVHTPKRLTGGRMSVTFGCLRLMSQYKYALEAYDLSDLSKRSRWHSARLPGRK